MRLKSVLSLVFFVFTLSPARADSEKSLKVGVVLGLTGAAASHAGAIRDGVQLARTELESEGWQITLNFQDDHTRAADTVTSFKMLLEQGYNYFIGPTWDFQVNAVKPLLSEREAVAFVPATSADTVGGSGKHMVYVCPPRSNQIPVLSSFLKERGIRDGISAAPHGSWGEIHSKIFESSLKLAGGRLLAEDRYDYGTDTSSLKSLLLRRISSHPQVILATGGSAELVNMIKARNALQLDPLLIVTADLRDALLDGALRRDEIRETDYIIGLDVDSAFAARYESHFGRAPRMYSDRGYMALKLLADAHRAHEEQIAALEEYANKKLLKSLEGQGYSLTEARAHNNWNK